MMRIEVISHRGILLDEQVEIVEGVSTEGAFGVLPGHAWMVMVLPPGKIVYRRGTHTEEIAHHGAVASVRGTSMIVFLEA